MTKDTQDAVAILKDLYTKVYNDDSMDFVSWKLGCLLLVSAIAHLAYPGRDVYPKVRHATKSKPVQRG